MGRLLTACFGIPRGCTTFQNSTEVENRFQTKLAITFSGTESIFPIRKMKNHCRQVVTL
jgi:hypothetical protein